MSIDKSAKHGNRCLYCILFHTYTICDANASSDICVRAAKISTYIRILVGVIAIVPYKLLVMPFQLH